MSTDRPFLARLGLLLASALVLSGCISLPDSGPVRSNPVPAVAEGEEFVRPVVTGPRPGMTPQEVVLGFLTAGTAPAENYAVARGYLTPAAADTWQAGAGVTVFRAGSLSTGAGEELAVAVDVIRTRTISEVGVLTDLSDESMTVSYPMARVDGEWRIDRPPAGLLLSDNDIESGYRGFDAHFLTPDGRLVVPDPRLVPRGQNETLATRAVQMVLAGPAADLAPAVRTAVPGGLRLAPSAVPVVDQTAMIDFTEQIRDLPDDSLDQLMAQISWSLRQVPGIERMQVTSEGTTVLLPGVSNPVSVDAWQRFDADLTEGARPLVGVDRSGQAVAWGETSEPLVDLEDGVRMQEVGQGPGTALIAAVGDDRRRLLLGDRGTPGPGWASVRGEYPAEVCVDRRNRVWTTRPDGTVSAVIWRGEGRKPDVTDVPGADRLGEVVDVEISRDGTRAGIVVLTGRGERRAAIGVVSGSQRQPRISALEWIGAERDVWDVSWRSADTLTVLAGGDQPRMIRYDLLGRRILDVPAEQGSIRVSDAPYAEPVFTSAEETVVALAATGPRDLADLVAARYRG